MDSRAGRRIDAVLRVRVKYPDVDTFISKYSSNISRGGIFVVTRTPEPLGTRLEFEFRLAAGEPLIRGEGEITWVKPYHADRPGEAHGMGLRFTRFDEPSRQLIERALAYKARRAQRRPPLAPVFEDRSAPTASDSLDRLATECGLTDTRLDEAFRRLRLQS